MSRTLKLAERLLALGRKLQRLGMTQEAERILTKLAGFRELPKPVAAQSRYRLGEICLGSRRFSQARRHFSAALAHFPQSARCHFLMATAARRDPRCAAKRALTHYRRSLKLNPDQPSCWTEYGRAALRQGKTRIGLTSLRRSFELKPNDPLHIGRILNALRRANCSDEARTLARTAMFRNPRDARFRQLWSRQRFHEVCAKQSQRLPVEQTFLSAPPCILPFRRLQSERRTRYRIDEPTVLAAPYLDQAADLPHRQHAT